jgi:group I intron endonuclease
MAVIYRITNIITKKIYIGETKEKDPYRRWKQHMNTIAKNKGCPALRDAVKKYGIENFKFKIMFFCFDQDRFKYEIECIDKYKCVVPNGYNICKGGYGGGFTNKKHTEETKQIISKNSKKIYIDNPELRKEQSERIKMSMNTPEIKNKIKQGMLNSDKWKKAIENKKIGLGKENLRLHTEESKKKIRDSINKYYAENKNRKETNIIKHREVMAKASGIKIAQYSLDGVFLNNYSSINEAARKLNIHSNSIKSCVSGKFKTGKGFIWKKQN